MDGHIVVVVANDGEDAVGTANGGVSSSAALNDQQARFTIRVQLVGGAHHVISKGTHKRKQTTFGILIISLFGGKSFRLELP